MGSTYYFGRRVLSAEPDLGEIGTNAQRFYTPNDLPVTIIAYRMGTRMGRFSGYGTPLVRLAIAQAQAGGTPDTLLRVSHEFGPSAVMTYGGDGAVYEPDLTEPLLMYPGKYSLGAGVGSPGVNHAMVQAAYISAQHEAFWYKSGIGGNWPTNPVGGSASNEGHMTIWVTGVTNTAPYVPSSLSPSGLVSSGDVTPQMESSFWDDEITLPNGAAWDYVNQVHIVVRRKSDQAIVWDYVYTANGTERANKRAVREYAGTAIVAGTDYEWTTRHSDRAGAWSGWAGWTTFNINPGGTVTQPTSPTGKILTLTPASFAATWQHVGGLSANAVEVRLKTPSGAVDRASGTIAKAVSPNAAFSITWAESGFSALSSGAGYTVEIRGRDTSGVWSPWSTGRDFTVNATPAIPTGLNPTSANPVSSLPLLSAETSDADNATSGLAMEFEITRADTSTVVRSGSYNATTGRFQYQTTGTDLAAPQTFTFRARAGDGTFWSAWSSPSTVIYGTGPSVTVTAPTEAAVLTTSTPTITWTATGQVSRRVRVYSEPDGALVHDSLTGTTAVQSYVVPSGLLRNGRDYSVQVDVTNNVPLTGFSQRRGFSLSFVPPTAISGVLAFPLMVGADTEATAIQITWEGTAYPTSVFEAYDVFRRRLSADENEDEPELVWLRRITSPLQTAFTDYHPRSGVQYEYIVTQTIRQDLDELTSEDATAQAQITLQEVVLASALQPTVYRANLRYLAGNAGMDHTLRFDQRQKVPMGSRRGRTIRGSYRSWEDGGRFAVVTDKAMTADARLKMVQDAAFNGKTFSLRDDRGRKRWVTITGYREFDRTSFYEVDLQFREEDFSEGEDIT